jgi:hypothetical protein|tara:strand:+ start:781 stop:909 length:129 start_codon:yes stop_codon:yes gene_type:complete
MNYRVTRPQPQPQPSPQPSPQLDEEQLEADRQQILKELPHTD